MVNRKSREDFDVIAGTSTALQSQYFDNGDWEGSPFAWLTTLPSATSGKMGRLLVAEWGRSIGMSVEAVTLEHQHYLKMDDQLVQIKLSTLWRDGFYRFQQIRDRDYDFCLCLGISPFDAHIWVVPKAQLDEHVIGVSGQHTGADSQETFWFDAGPGSVANWLRPFGNQFSDAREILLGSV